MPTDAPLPVPPARDEDREDAPGPHGELARFLREFLGWTDRDRHHLNASATIVLPHAKELLDHVYERLLAFPSTRRYFVDGDDRPNQPFLEKRRKTLFEWFAMTATGWLDERLVRYVDEVARRHVAPEGQPRVPLAEVEALYGVLEEAIVQRLRRDRVPVEELAPAVVAWTKMLAAQRAVFAWVYEGRSEHLGRSDHLR